MVVMCEKDLLHVEEDLDKIVNENKIVACLQLFYSSPRVEDEKAADILNSHADVRKGLKSNDVSPIH